MGCGSSKFGGVDVDAPVMQRTYCPPLRVAQAADATSAPQEVSGSDVEVATSAGGGFQRGTVEVAAGASAEHPGDDLAAAEAASADPVPASQLDNLLKQLQAVNKQDSAPAPDQLLQLIDAALEQLQQQASKPGLAKAAKVVLDKLEPHVNALQGLAAAFKGAVSDVKGGAFIREDAWKALGSTATALLRAGTAATYIGPVFALLGYAIKQWSTCQQLPKEAVDLLTATRDIVFDLNRAWKHLTEQQQQQQQQQLQQQQQSSPQQQLVVEQRLQRWLNLAAEAAAECVVVHKQQVVFRFALAHSYTASLGKQAEALKSKRDELHTLLLQALADKLSDVEADAVLHKNEILMKLAPVFRPIPSLIGKVGRDELIEQLRLQLLSGDGVKGLLLHGLGGIGKTTVATLLVHHMQQITPSPFPGGVYMVSV